jgi:hypothetical protein
MPVALTGCVPVGEVTAAMSAATVIICVITIAFTLSIHKRER